MNEVILYRQNVNSVGSWRIWSEGEVIHIAHATVIGGSEVRHQEIVSTNRSGRTLDEQVALRIKSRISRMMDKGYKATVEEARANPGNQLGLDRPMLAQQIGKVKNINYSGAVIQKKLDGHRCLITRQDGELIAYSRQGKRIDAITHIYEALEDRLPEGVTLDGELYCHGVPLQTIGSWVKRKQPNTALISFVCYDMISNESYRDRWNEINGILQRRPDAVLQLPYREYVSAEETMDYFKRVREDGFEGLMLRVDNRGYQAGIRSNSLLKIKEFDQAEFEVVGFTQSKTGWAICQCVTDQGRGFEASAPGSHAEKMHVWENQDQYIGRRLTIDFAHWTNDGLPFQPTAVRWREDI